MSLALVITRARVSSYIRAQLEDGAKPAMIRNERAALNRMFTLFVRSGQLTEKPYISSIEAKNVSTGLFEAHQVQAVTEYLPEDSCPRCRLRLFDRLAGGGKPLCTMVPDRFLDGNRSIGARDHER